MAIIWRLIGMFSGKMVDICVVYEIFLTVGVKINVFVSLCFGILKKISDINDIGVIFDKPILVLCDLFLVL